jgi:hypothetical protein
VASGLGDGTSALADVVHPFIRIYCCLIGGEVKRDLPTLPQVIGKAALKRDLRSDIIVKTCGEKPP